MFTACLPSADILSVTCVVVLVVLVTDAKINYDNYRRMLTATADAKTIFITNPGLSSSTNSIVRYRRIGIV